MTEFDYRSHYPHINFSGGQVFKFFEYQLLHNEKLSQADRAWFAAMLTLMRDCLKDYEGAIMEAKMQGLRQPSFLGDEMGNTED